MDSFFDVEVSDCLDSLLDDVVGAVDKSVVPFGFGLGYGGGDGLDKIVPPECFARLPVLHLARCDNPTGRRLLRPRKDCPSTAVVVPLPAASSSTKGNVSKGKAKGKGKGKSNAKGKEVEDEPLVLVVPFTMIPENLVFPSPRTSPLVRSPPRPPSLKIRSKIVLFDAKRELLEMEAEQRERSRIGFERDFPEEAARRKVELLAIEMVNFPEQFPGSMGDSMALVPCSSKQQQLSPAPSTSRHTRPIEASDSDSDNDPVLPLPPPLVIGDVTCPTCHKTFSCTRSRNRHHRTQHPRPEPAAQPKLTRPPLPAAEFACDKCEKVYRRKDGLFRHIALHKNPDRYKCGECEKTYRSSESLKHHTQKCKN